MKIAIVEDEKVQQDYLSKMLQTIAEEKQLTLSLRVFESAEAFLFAIEEEKMDAVLLDIELKNINGYELAELIRKKDKKIPLAFITGVKDFVFDGYKVDACGYILKPIKKESVEQLIIRIIEKLSLSEKNVMVKTKEGIINIYENDICYIESANHNTIIRAINGDYISNIKLSKWIEELSSDTFFKPHRCYIINLGLIEKIEKTYILMKKNSEIPIARGMWQELMKAYLTYRRKDY